MAAELIKGAEVAKQIREELAQEITDLKEKHNVVPGLVTVLVGADPASQVYVGAKEKTSQELGIYSERYDLPETTNAGLVLREDLNVPLSSLCIAAVHTEKVRSEKCCLITPGSGSNFHNYITLVARITWQ